MSSFRLLPISLTNYKKTKEKRTRNICWYSLSYLLLCIITWFVSWQSCFFLRLIFMLVSFCASTELLTFEVRVTRSDHDLCTEVINPFTANMSLENDQLQQWWHMYCFAMLGSTSIVIHSVKQRLLRNWPKSDAATTSCAKDYKGHSLVQISSTELSNIYTYIDNAKSHFVKSDAATSCVKDYKGHSLVQFSSSELLNIYIYTHTYIDKAKSHFVINRSPFCNHLVSSSHNLVIILHHLVITLLWSIGGHLFNMLLPSGQHFAINLASILLTLQALLSGAFLQTLPKLVMPLLLISAQLSSNAVSALRKVWVLTTLWKQHSIETQT